MFFNIYIRITSNNIIMSINNSNNKPVNILTSGQLVPKLKGRKKVSKVSAKLLSELSIKKLKTKKCYKIKIYFFGNKKNRKTIIKEFWKKKIKIKSISDLTPIPHNGCKLKKKKRI